jgi:TatD DNase family protein
MPGLTDSHCHLASHRFNADEVATLVAGAANAGVTRMVTLATNLEDLQANLDIAAAHPAVHVAAGIHPCDVHVAPADAISHIDRACGDPRVVAVGESGLDYFHPAPDGWDEKTFRHRQIESLEHHFELAARHSLNIVLHTRDRSGDASFRDALAVYSGFADRVRAVFHCFPYPWQAARQILDLSGLVSFTGIVTFPSAADAVDCATRCPAGSFMLETDSPYLAPVPLRGKRNQPAYVRHIAEFLAAERGESLGELAAHTNATADGFFRFRPDDQVS